MLVFTTLGYLCILLMALNYSQSQVAKFFSAGQFKVLSKSLEASFQKMLLRSLFLVFTEASPQRTQMTALAFYNLRILGKRASLLLMALSNLGAWWILLLALLFMNVNLLSLVGLSLLPFLFLRNFAPVRQLFLILVSVSVFLMAGEMVIRSSGTLLASLGESPLIFWLADGRLHVVLGLVLTSMLMSMIIRLEFWSVAVALCLLFSSFISFNGAIALFVGERLASNLLYVWRSQRLNQDCRKVVRQQSGFAVLGAFIGLFVVLYLREITNLGRSFGISEAQGRLFDFVGAMVLVMFLQFLLQMLIGHFSAQKNLDELQDVRYFPSSWFQSGLISRSGEQWSRTQIAKRIQEIRYHIQGLTTFKEGQIPEHVKTRLHKEEEELAKLSKQPVS